MFGVILHGKWSWGIIWRASILARLNFLILANPIGSSSFDHYAQIGIHVIGICYPIKCYWSYSVALLRSNHVSINSMFFTISAYVQFADGNLLMLFFVFLYSVQWTKFIVFPNVANKWKNLKNFSQW